MGGANYWLSLWAQDKPVIVNGTAFQDGDLTTNRLAVYAVFGFLQGKSSFFISIQFLLILFFIFFRTDDPSGTSFSGSRNSSCIYQTSRRDDDKNLKVTHGFL